MNYMVCIPSPDMVSRENCEKVHNILARMSDAYKLNIVPEPVKVKQAPRPEYYRKYRIYKEIRERDGNGEAYLLRLFSPAPLISCFRPGLPLFLLFLFILTEAFEDQTGRITVCIGTALHERFFLWRPAYAEDHVLLFLEKVGFPISIPFTDLLIDPVLSVILRRGPACEALL